MDKATLPAAPAVQTDLSRSNPSAGGTIGAGNALDSRSADGGASAQAQGSAGNAFVAGSLGQQSASGAPALPPGFDPDAKAQALHAAMSGWGTDERAILDVLYSGGAGMNAAVASAYQRRYGSNLKADLQSELSGADLEKALKLLSQGQLTLADKIREGARGWGTDETRIFQALERASAQDLAGVKADAEVMGILSSELSGEDYKLALAYLDGQGVLAASLRRAIDGLGTDEQAIWDALSRASQAEKAFVLAQPALTRDVRRDLSDKDWFRFEKMLRGTLDNVDRIELAMMGWGTDEEGVQGAIAALTAEEYGRLPGDIDARIDGELSGRDQALAREALHQKRIEFDADYRNAYMAKQTAALGQGALQHEGASALLAQQGQAHSAVGRLLAAVTGMGTDDTTVWTVLSELSSAERSFILDFNPEGVLDALRADLSGSDYQRLLSVLGGGGAAALIGVATSGWGTDEGMIYRTIDRAAQEGTAAALLADADAVKALQKDLSPARYEVVMQVLSTGRFDARQRVLWATLGAGTDEDLLFAVLGKHGAELRQGQGIVGDVDQILQAELSTSEYWRALDLIRGEPRTEADRLARAKEQLERERGGAGDAIVGAFSASGERADDAWREYQATYNNASMDGQFSEQETATLRRDEQFSQQSTAAYAQTKATVAAWATQIAVAVVGAAATILTAGAAGPFVAGIAASLGGNVAIAAEAMVMAAAMKVGLNRAILGEGYDLQSMDALIDGVGASLEIGLSMVGGHLAGKVAEGLSKTAVARSVGPSIEKVLGGAGRRILAAGMEGGIDGAIGGLGEGAFKAAAQESTWRGDVEDMFGRVSGSMIRNSLQSGAGGFATKTAFASLGEVYGAYVAAKHGEDPSKYPVPGDPDVDEAGKPIRRQQDDALPGLRDKHASNQYQDFEDGQAFVKGRTDEADIDPNDVKQGALGDCYLMAGMAAQARAEPEAIRRIIKDNGDGTFEVTLYIRNKAYSQPVAMTRTIDARLPVKSADTPLYAGLGDATDEGDELWVALIEKRLAQEKGSYDLISGGNIAKGFHFNGASELFTGKAERYFSTSSLSEDRVLQMMQAALDGKKPITVDSMNMENLPDLTKEANAVNVYGNHAYAVQAVDIANKTVTLQNPWGSHHVTDLPVKDFMRFYRAVRVGGN